MRIIRKSQAYIKESMDGTGKAYYIYCALLLIIASVGIFYNLRFIEVGHGISGLNDMVPWGIYISGLAFFIGCSAGATMVGLMIHAFGREEYHPVGTRAIILALLSIFAAVQCIMLDVGNPFRAMKIPFLLRNETSMFFVSSSSYMGFMALLTAELVFTIKLTLGTVKGTVKARDKKIARILGIGAVPYALVVVHSFTGTIFGVVKAREMWNTPLLPVHFVTSALASGFALVILVAVITSIIEKKALLSDKAFNHMGTLLCYFLIATLFLDVFDYIILLYSATEEGMEIWHLLTGRFSPLFILNLGGLALAMIIVTFKKGRTQKGLLIATVVTLLAIGAYRINIISVSQLIPLFSELGELQYVPTPAEIAPLVGLIALLMFLYAVLTKLLPLEDKVHIAEE